MPYCSTSLAVCLIMAAVVSPLRAQIRSDEVVLFYPTYAYRGEDGDQWKAGLHGVIYEPEQFDVGRTALVGVLHRLLDLKVQSAESRRFDERLRLFLIDPERRKEVSVTFNEIQFDLPASDADGHFQDTLTLDASLVERLQEPETPSWITYRALTPGDDQRDFAGRIQLIEPRGISVISDIDDTIKVTSVLDPRQMLRHTLLLEAVPVDGMPEVYRTLAQQGACFHYVSAMPWQLYEPLADFLAAHDLPAGSVHLRAFRFGDGDLRNLLAHEKFKRPVIEQIMADFPQRRFILIGDTAGQDPEIYAAVARRCGDGVVAIFIRTVGGQGDVERLRAAFEDVEQAKWSAFAHADQLQEQLKSIDWDEQR